MHNKRICPCYPITGLDKPSALQEFDVPIISRKSTPESGTVFSRTYRSPSSPENTSCTYFCHPASCKMGTGSIPGVKCGRGVLLSLTRFQCRSHGRVELYLYPPFGPHRACNGITLPFTYFYQGLKQPQGHSAAGRTTSMKNLIRIRIRDLPACRAVPQPTASRRTLDLSLQYLIIANSVLLYSIRI